MVNTYADKCVTAQSWCRTFSHSVPDQHLVWHRDHVTRQVKVLSGTGWCLQMDNQLPQLLQPGDTIIIQAGVYHRIIKGDQDLVILITELMDHLNLRD